MTFFFDTSALVKLFHRKEGSEVAADCATQAGRDLVGQTLERTARALSYQVLNPLEGDA